MLRRKSAWLRPSRNALHISVITDPLPHRARALTQPVIRTVRRYRDVARQLRGSVNANPVSPYRGHPAVTRSLIEGLTKLGVPFSYNPSTLENLSQSVIVLSGVAALRQMIQLKQEGYIRCLLAGPNITSDPSAHGAILAAPEVDFCVTPSEPISRLHERFLPALARRCVSWPAGVNCQFWTPRTAEGSKRALVYRKTAVHPQQMDAYVEELYRRGYQVEVICYGSYNSAEYRRLLHGSDLMVAFTRSESQGIAWAEAWSCDVPTLIVRSTECTYLGVRYEASSAPYLTAATGAFFSDLAEFRAALSSCEERRSPFAPRRWCLENMSDEVSASRLLTIAAAA